MFGNNGSDLDIFYSNMYKFYCYRGLAAILITQFCNIITVAFTVCLSILLVAFVNWSLLLQCENETSCHSLRSYIVSHPFQHSTSRAVISIIYMVLCISW